METKSLNVELRTKTGKGISRQLRSAGRLPGVVYGKGMEPTAISLDQRELVKTISGDGAMNSLLTLNGGEGLNGSVVIIADLTVEPLKGTPKHVDLHKVNMDEKVRVEVSIKLKGTAKGVKDGGLLDFVKHSVEIECLPALIPAHLDLDITGLTIGHSIHVSELPLPANVRLLDDPKASIVSVLGKAKEEAAAEA
ncbi:MAG TPA: 50S ribosomal protein L25 [Geobacteraceae bacterium]|nr:50S ribosomal protein L25 [Geobacteraceae bacterium]